MDESEMAAMAGLPAGPILNPPPPPPVFQAGGGGGGDGGGGGGGGGPTHIRFDGGGLAGPPPPAAGTDGGEGGEVAAVTRQLAQVLDSIIDGQDRGEQVGELKLKRIALKGRLAELEGGPGIVAAAPAAGMRPPGAPAHYCRGEIAQVFYRSHEQDEYGYFPVPVGYAGSQRPRFGRSDGWMDVLIEEDWPNLNDQRQAGADDESRPEGGGVKRGGGKLWRKAIAENGRPYWYHTQTRESTWEDPEAGQAGSPRRTAGVRIRHIHRQWSDREGQRLDPERYQDMVMDIKPRDVRKRPAVTPQVSLSVLILRRGSKTERGEFNEEQWGPVSSSVSDQYVTAVERTFYGALGPDYEVFTAWIDHSSDMEQLMPAAISAAMTGKHKAACYFLWPTTFQDASTDEAGMVHKNSYFTVVHGMEACGVCTRFPHPAPLYDTLLAKDWQCMLCLYPKLKIPPATMVNRGAIAADPRRAARKAMDALDVIRAKRFEDGKEATGTVMDPVGEGSMQTMERRGVAKLGYAWEAAQVQIYRGEAELAKALYDLTRQPGCENNGVIVQDFVANNLEARCFVVRGQVVHVVYSNFKRTDDEGYLCEFEMMNRQQAIGQWLDGDEKAMAAAERKITKLIGQWLVWCRCRDVDEPPCIRMDFLINKPNPGQADVHTLELTELGFSMLAWDEGPAHVFSALIDSCFEDIGPSEAEARRLAKYRSLVQSGFSKSGF